MISFFIALVLFIASPLQADAQTVSFDRILQTNIQPKSPAPGQQVTISIENYTYDLARADISWSVNGVAVSKGIGMKTFTTTVGKAGAVTNVKVNIKTSEGTEFDQTFPFSPATVDLVWEANTYAPSWYKGKALHTNEAITRIVAFPQIVSGGSMLKPENLIYKWSSDGSSVPDQSGYGERTFFLIGDIIARPKTISVEVTDTGGGVQASGSIVVEATEPVVRVYENNAIYGLLYNDSISSFDLNKDEISLMAVPFFYSITGARSPEISYVWSSNGVNVNQKTPFITFGNEGKEGTASVSLQINHVKNILQSASNGFNINFKKIVQTSNGASSI
jgi:hypothetical protein